jgi:hypothetical protein
VTWLSPVHLQSMFSVHLRPGLLPTKDAGAHVVGGAAAALRSMLAPPKAAISSLQLGLLPAHLDSKAQASVLKQGMDFLALVTAGGAKEADAECTSQ